ncbi:hypothetical protein LCGC14_1068540 [marine sediment metagenome]|uniref:RNase NYN domain-containing protein n=1 Tax=marine sediment metagenome TaxID=412755 RepID=A0A0F9MNW2_9ZZZZ
MIKIKKIIIVCDISNICYYNTRGDQPKLKNIDLLFSSIPEDIEFIGIADCSLYHTIDEKLRYKEEYLIPKLITEAPSSTRADDFILNFAVKNNAFILSNDRFLEYDFISKGWLDAHKINFMIINDQLIFQRPMHLIFKNHQKQQNDIGKLDSDGEIIMKMKKTYI